MTDAIGATGAYAAAAPTAASTAASPATGFNAMGSDAFLKLLVAQLKYQDPSHPTDGTQMLAQTANFQMVEKLQQMADTTQQLVAEQQTVASVSLVGRSVSYSDNGHDASGVVSAVKFGPGGPVLTVGSSEVPLAAVTEVRSAG